LLNHTSSGIAVASGARGFFTPQPVAPWFQPDGTIEATSFYDTHDLKRTLEQLVDFDRLNSGAVRFSASAVNVRTGNFVYFDTAMRTIRPEHVMASGALPPGFPAIEIEGEYYWDGSLVSNTPLQWVVDAEPRRDTLAFQVDLWSARGDFPRNIFEVMMRDKEIRYSSRTRASTDQFNHVQRLRHALAGLLENLPEDVRSSPEAHLLGAMADRRVYNIVHLIYRARDYEGHSKDYEFSRLSMESIGELAIATPNGRCVIREYLSGPPTVKESLLLIFTQTDVIRSVRVEARRRRRCDNEAAMPGCRELSIKEMLADPVVRALMSADGVHGNELGELLCSVATLLRARSLKDGKGLLEGKEAATGEGRRQKIRLDGSAGSD
jgi:predicted acylesterase/phospholipase RssA